MKSLAEIAAQTFDSTSVADLGDRAKLQPKRIYEGPPFDGRKCSTCERKYKTTAEYLVCKLCGALVCRKGNCKHLHAAAHRVAMQKAQRKEEA